MMSNKKSLVRNQVGALPLILNVVNRMQLRKILSDYLSQHGSELISPVDTLFFLICNLTLGKMPLYKLSDWVAQLDLKCLNCNSFAQLNITDDRFGRALDKLYQADRASLLTTVVIAAVREFNIDLGRIHNDSTSIKAFGNIPGKTKNGVELKRGHSKDHRPDLKQLIFNLSISADGGVPIHHKVYSGNRTDDSIHIETWNTLVSICGHRNFMYVADSKLCTDVQLNHIVSNSGKAITILPKTWGEYKAFIKKLRTTKISKQEIWRRTKPGTAEQIEYFSVFTGKHLTDKRGYAIHWIYSSEKKKRDREDRNIRLQKAEKQLTEIIGKLNTKNYDTEARLLDKCSEILAKYYLQKCIDIQIGKSRSRQLKQISKGRPGPNTKYEEIIHEVYTLTWLRNSEALDEEMKLDGVFPLVCTDTAITPGDVLRAYKYQPKIEKRFSQFKSVHNAAPLLFQKISRVEANLFAFFLALMIQALIEREVKKAMELNKIDTIDVYPEHRCAGNPTSNAMFELFESVSTYKIYKDDKVIETYRDDLTETQKQILKLLKIDESDYWGDIS